MARTKSKSPRKPSPKKTMKKETEKRVEATPTREKKDTTSVSSPQPRPPQPPNPVAATAAEAETPSFDFWLSALQTSATALRERQQAAESRRAAVAAVLPAETNNNNNNNNNSNSSAHTKAELSSPSQLCGAPTNGNVQNNLSRNNNNNNNNGEEPEQQKEVVTPVSMSQQEPILVAGRKAKRKIKTSQKDSTKATPLVVEVEAEEDVVLVAADHVDPATREPSHPAAVKRRKLEGGQGTTTTTTTTMTEEESTAPASTSHRHARPRPQPLVRDLMPLLPSLLEGALGPIAVDVEVLGEVSLLSHPQAFASILERCAAHSLTTGSASPTTESSQDYILRVFHSIRLYGMLRPSAVLGTTAAATEEPQQGPPSWSGRPSLALFTVDPASYPTLPLIALLLRTPTVRKLLCHAELLLQLLCLFLGTERVEIAEVVDAGVWTDVARQAADVSGMMRLPVAFNHNYGSHRAVTEAAPSEGETSAAAAAPTAAAMYIMEKALSEERRLLIAQCVRDAAQQQRTYIHYSNTHGEEEGEDAGSSVSSSSASSSYSASSSSSEKDDDDEGVEADAPTPEAQQLQKEQAALLADLTDELRRNGQAGHTESVATEKPKKGEKSVGKSSSPKKKQRTALDLLNELEVVEEGTTAHRKRRRRYEVANTTTTTTTTIATKEGDSRLVTHRTEVCHHLLCVYFYYTDLLDAVVQPPLRLGTLLLTLPGDAPAAAALRHPVYDACERATYATMMAVMMGYHGIFVSKTTFNRMTQDLHAQIKAILRKSEAQLVRYLGPATETPPSLPQLEVADLQQPLLRLLLEQRQQETDSLAILVVQQLLTTCEDLRGAAEKVKSLHTNLIAASSTSQHKYLPLQEGMARLLQSAGADNVADEVSQTVQLFVFLLQCWIAIKERETFVQALTDYFRSQLAVHVRYIPPQAYHSDSADPAPSGTAALSPKHLFYVVYPQWSVHTHYTGRIYCSRPNMQTINKQPPCALYSVAALRPPPSPSASSNKNCNNNNNNNSNNSNNAQVVQEAVSAKGQSHCPLFQADGTWTLRHLYVPPPGCVFVSLDFNQIELRVLAHLSGDPLLCAQLTSGEDVLRSVAAQLQHGPTVAGEAPAVPDTLRQAVKVIVYGLLYGMGKEQMDAHIQKITAAEDGSAGPPLSASELIARFYDAYPHVRIYLQRTRLDAYHHQVVQTLGLGRRDLREERDPNRRKQQAVALAVQGGAATILQAAMRAIHRRRYELLPLRLPAAPAALVLSVHDELVYAVPEQAATLLAPRLKAVMEEAGQELQLSVPLRVSTKMGPSLGELRAVQL